MQYAASRVDLISTMFAETERTCDDRKNAIIAVHNCAASNPQCKNIAINSHTKA